MQTHEETRRAPDADPCLRRALSVFRSRTDAEHQILLFRRWRKKFIFKARLSPQHGSTKLTSGRQPSHTSWWTADGLSPERRAALFTMVETIES